MVGYGGELAVATAAARRAGEVILRYHRTDVVVERKAENEPVTRADREASELILEALAGAFPADLLVSEENPGQTERLGDAGRVWFVDPLDGTRDFIRGNVGFSVMIGLSEDGQPRLGVVHQPLGGRTFLAAPGHGAVLDGPEGRRTLACSDISDLTEIRLVASKSHRTDKIDEVKSALGISDELNIGSVGLKLGLIALGERDLYVNPSSQTKAWDTCAPEAILSLAGGRMTDLYGDPLRYDDPGLRNRRGLVASNGRLHEAILAKLRPLFPSP